MLRGPINGAASQVLHGLQLTTGIVLCCIAALMKGPSISRAVASVDSIPNVTWPDAGNQLPIGNIPDTIRGFTNGSRLLNRLVDEDCAIPVLVAVYTGLNVVTWVSPWETVLTTGVAALGSVGARDRERSHTRERSRTRKRS